jgi:hypothetical protein
MFFPYDFTHTFIILLFTAGASSGVLNRIGFANKSGEIRTIQNPKETIINTQFPHCTLRRTSKIG